MKNTFLRCNMSVKLTLCAQILCSLAHLKGCSIKVVSTLRQAHAHVLGQNTRVSKANKLIVLLYVNKPTKLTLSFSRWHYRSTSLNIFPIVGRSPSRNRGMPTFFPGFLHMLWCGPFRQSGVRWSHPIQRSARARRGNSGPIRSRVQHTPCKKHLS